MDENLFTHLERSGTQALLPRSATREERLGLSLHLQGLRTAGHSISCDEVREQGEATGEIRVLHLLSCCACKRTVL